MELEQVLPCGDWLLSEEAKQGRIYYLRKDGVDWPIWNPARVHRTALLAAILAEDGYKYEASQPIEG